MRVLYFAVAIKDKGKKTWKPRHMVEYGGRIVFLVR